jgi:hypothetical protein
MLGLLGALAVSANKSAFKVGDDVVYTITGGPPGAAISWSSWKNGQSTGEGSSFYNQYLDENGEAVLPAGVWDAQSIGTWRKRVHILDDSGQPVDSADVIMTVSAQASSQSSSFFSGSINLPGVGDVPNWTLLAGAGLLFLALSGGRRR